MPHGSELVVPNVVFDGQVDLIYSFLGQSDDGGVRYVGAEPMPAGLYDYSFECLSIEGDMPMHVRICDQIEVENDRVRGATAPGEFSGTIEVSAQAASDYPDSILLSVTGSPTKATARNLSVRRVID